MQWLATPAGIYYVDKNRFTLAQDRIFSGNQASGRETTELSIPNIITLGRIILVPIIVWAIASSQMEIAFAIFIVAGVSDAVDGFLAKRFNMASELGC